MKIGLKNVVLLGTDISTLATLATAVASNTVELVLLRLLVGAGLALMFTPGVSLIADLLS